MLKSLWLLARNPEIPLAEFAQHWFEVHAQLHIGPGHKLFGYVQHHTHAMAYDQEPRPTHDGASINWFPDVTAYRDAIQTEAFRNGIRDGQGGVRGLPLGQRPLPFVLGEERVMLEGETGPLMIKVIMAVRCNPAIERNTFHHRWVELHRAGDSAIPGIRRSVQNHAVEEMPQLSENPWDGWSEMWFEDMHAVQTAFASPQWTALREQERELLAEQAFVIGRERWILPRSA